jgi:hypothetical protein
MYYILCITYCALHTMYYILCTTYYVLHTMYYILCITYLVCTALASSIAAAGSSPAETGTARGPRARLAGSRNLNIYGGGSSSGSSSSSGSGN